MLWDDKSKKRYKVKIDNIQGYDPYQIKNEELSGDISKFPLAQWHSLLQLITLYFHCVYPMTKEELKALESYSMFALGSVKEVKINNIK